MYLHHHLYAISLSTRAAHSTVVPKIGQSCITFFFKVYLGSNFHRWSHLAQLPADVHSVYSLVSKNCVLMFPSLFWLQLCKAPLCTMNLIDSLRINDQTCATASIRNTPHVLWPKCSKVLLQKKNVPK